MNFSTSLSVWSQLSSLCFFLAGIYGDLLLIRLFCFLAYCLLLTNAILPDVVTTTSSVGIGQMGLDTLLWSSICIYVHGSSLVSLLLDERKVDLTPDEEALWRLLYRTAGLSKRLFRELFITKSKTEESLKVLELESGKLIPTDDYFYIIYQGQVRLQVLDPMTGVPTRTRRVLVSGEMFDLKYLGLISAETIFSRGALKCTSLTPVKLFQIPKNHMKEMAQHNLAKTALQALLINNLSFAAESFINTDTKRSYMAAKHCDKVFRPLEEWELPPRLAAGSGRALENPLGHLCRALLTTISPPWPLVGHPTGVRQTQLAPPPKQQQHHQAAAPPLFHRLSRSFRMVEKKDSSRSVMNEGSSDEIIVAADDSSSSSTLSPDLEVTSYAFNDERMEVPTMIHWHAQEYETTASA